MSLPVSLGVTLIRLGADIAAGDVKDGVATARALLGLAIDAIPVSELKGFLDERERRFIDLENDIAEQIKLEAVEAEKR